MRRLLETYKVQILFHALFSINALATICAAAFTGVNWETLTDTQLFVIICSIIGNWTGTILALWNKDGSKPISPQFSISANTTTDPGK